MTNKYYLSLIVLQQYERVQENIECNVTSHLHWIRLYLGRMDGREDGQINPLSGLAPEFIAMFYWAMIFKHSVGDSALDLGRASNKLEKLKHPFSQHYKPNQCLL